MSLTVVLCLSSLDTETLWSFFVGETKEQPLNFNRPAEKNILLKNKIKYKQQYFIIQHVDIQMTKVNNHKGLFKKKKKVSGFFSSNKSNLKE